MATKKKTSKDVNLTAEMIDMLDQALVAAAPLTALEEAQMIATGGIVEIDQAQEEAVVENEAEVAAEDEARSFGHLLSEVTMEQEKTMQADLALAFADRAAFEQQTNPSNDNIQKTIRKLIAAYSTPNVARALVVLKVGAGHINETEQGVKRRNVYALDKIRDVLYGAVTGHMKNAINIACLTSIFKLEVAKEPFTMSVAKMCASDKIAAPAHLKALLRRHTVSESTASTQASSTMTALEVLGVVKNVGTRNHPSFMLTNSPLTTRLRDMFAPAAK